MVVHTTSITSTPLHPQFIKHYNHVFYIYNIHAGKCYQAFYQQRTWVEAYYLCQSYGGDLASISSQGENDFIGSIVEEDVWIGGHDLTEDGTWKWSDHTPWGYENWSTGYPNNYKCVYLRPSYSGVRLIV